MPALVVRDGASAGTRLDVQGEVTLGRETTDILQQDGEASRRHAVVRESGGGLTIEDLASANGTFVNEQRISVPTRLNAGDVVRVGQTRLEVEVETSGRTVVRKAPSATTATPQPAGYPAGAPPYAQPPPSGTNTTLIVGLVVGGVVLIGVIVAVLLLAGGGIEGTYTSADATVSLTVESDGTCRYSELGTQVNVPCEVDGDNVSVTLANGEVVTGRVEGDVLRFTRADGTELPLRRTG
jgi:pSer/pThr/pTyr-binding forkhead associated (FHA) protein